MVSIKNSNKKPRKYQFLITRLKIIYIYICVLALKFAITKLFVKSIIKER